MREILPRLPQSISDQAPDYDALLKADISEKVDKKEESSQVVTTKGEEK